MKRNRFLAMALALAFAVTAAGCGGQTKAPAAPAPSSGSSQPASGSSQPGSSQPAQGQSSAPAKSVKINITTGTTTGVYYFLGNGLAQLWNQKIPGMQASSQSTDGSVANMNLMARKESEVALTVATVAREAYLGEEKFKGRPFKELRVIGAMYPNYNQLVVRADSGIQKVTDLKGKRFIPGAKGSATAIDALRILEAYGIKESDLKLDYVGFTEAIDLMQNNQAQAAMIQAGLPTPAVVQASQSFDVRVLPIDQEVLDKIIKALPVYQDATVPANTYKGQTQDVKTLGQTNLLVVRADVDADVVYQMTKAVFENVPALVQVHKAAADIKLENALKGLGGIPLHPGAERYYKEKGLIK